MKLHLGCGQVKLDGYVNIDFPLSQHSLQTYSIADELADVTKLRYTPASIEEVRNHHFFEHFIRPQALGLLSSWHSWLKPGGKIHIEVPDFNRSAKLVLSKYKSFNDKAVALRHIFGSNEADWAVHYEGWSKENLTRALKLHGFGQITFKYSGYKATRNITVTAIKTTNYNRKELHKQVKDYLDYFLVETTSKSEQDLADIWLSAYTNQVDAGWASKNARGSSEPAAQVGATSQPLPAGQLNWDNCEPALNGEYWWLESQARNWKNVFDIGANRGDYTKKVRAINANARIYCFEPNKKAASHIEKHKQVSVYAVAVGNKTGSLKIHINKQDDTQSSAYRKNKHTELASIPQITLDEFTAEHKISHIDFVKIDTEGHELSVLQGAKRLIKAQAIDSMQFEYGGTYTDSKTTLEQVFKLLADNYYTFHLLPGGLLPVRWDPALETYQYSNWIAISRTSRNK